MYFWKGLIALQKPIRLADSIERRMPYRLDRSIIRSKYISFKNSFRLPEFIRTFGSDTKREATSVVMVVIRPLAIPIAFDVKAKYWGLDAAKEVMSPMCLLTSFRMA